MPQSLLKFLNYPILNCLPCNSFFFLAAENNKASCPRVPVSLCLLTHPRAFPCGHAWQGNPLLLQSVSIMVVISLIFWAYCCCRCCLVTQSCPTLCNPMDCSPPLPMGFPRQECWSGLPFPSLGDLPNPGIELMSPVRILFGMRILYH